MLKVNPSQNINYLDNFWDLYERLPLETARYVPRFLATLHVIDVEMVPPAGRERLCAVWTRSKLSLDQSDFAALASVQATDAPSQLTRDITCVAETFQDLPRFDYQLAILDIEHLASRPSTDDSGAGVSGICDID